MSRKEPAGVQEHGRNYHSNLARREDDKRSQFYAWLQETKPKWFEDLRTKYKAHRNASLIWTGSDDDRPGECQVGADSWVLGFGLHCEMLFNAVIHSPISFRRVAQWWTWVTASG